MISALRVSEEPNSSVADAPLVIKKKPHRLGLHDILNVVGIFLTARDIASLEQTSGRMANAVGRARLWENLFEKQSPYRYPSFKKRVKECTSENRRVLSWRQLGGLQAQGREPLSSIYLACGARCIERGPDDRHAIGCADGNILFGSSPGQFYQGLSCPSKVTCLAISETGVVGAGYASDFGRLWPPHTSQMVVQLRLWISNIITLTNGDFVSSSWNIIQRYTDNGEFIGEAEHQASIRCLAPLSKARFATGCDDFTVHIWSSTTLDDLTMKCELTLDEPGCVKQILVSPDGHFTTLSLRTDIWQITRIATIYSPEGKQLESHRHVRCAAVTSDGIALGGQNGFVTLYKPPAKLPVLTFDSHSTAMRCIMQAPTKEIITGDNYGVTRIFSSRGIQLARLEGHAGPVRKIVSLSSGEILTLAGRKKLLSSVHLWAPDPTLLSAMPRPPLRRQKKMDIAARVVAGIAAVVLLAAVFVRG